MNPRGKHFYRNNTKREAKKMRLLGESISLWRLDEFEGICISNEWNAVLSEIPTGYRGLVLHISDHGNISLLKAFKNGNTHYIAGIV
jgi:hypothetical protein